MINTIKRWREARRQALERQEFEVGYGWALAAYMIEGEDVETIEMMVWGNPDQFDLGARRALIDIAAYKMIPHGGSYYGPQSDQ